MPSPSDIAPPSNESPRPNVEVRLGTWGIRISPRSSNLQLYRAGRPELAHLSIFWNTDWGGIDIHLTYGHEAAMTGAAPKDHRPLLAISHAEWNALGAKAGTRMNEIMREAILRRYRRFRPGWLARNGYGIQVVERVEMAESLKAAAPKRRGKFRIEAQAFIAGDRLPDSVRDLYSPMILNTLKRLGVRAGLMSNSEVIVTAVHRSRDNGAAIMLTYDVGPNGRLGWWGIPNADIIRMQRRVAATFFDWVVPLVQPHHAEAFEAIVAGLAIDDSDAGRDFVARVLAFLARPRSPVRQPFDWVAPF